MNYSQIKKLKNLRASMISRILNSKTLNKQDISKLFPKTAVEIKKYVSEFIKDAQKKIDAIINIKPENRTFENTIKAFDTVSSLSDIAIFLHCLGALEMLSPKKDIRDAAQAEILKIQDFLIEKFSNNVILYKAIKEYAENNTTLLGEPTSKSFTNKPMENLSQQEQAFIKETIEDYKRAGLDLPTEKLEEVKKLNKELAELELKFETNISQDNKAITATIAELDGCEQEFIDALEKEHDCNSQACDSNKTFKTSCANKINAICKTNEDDQTFILGTDYPTYFYIMDNCSVESTREKLYIAFSNRAYPENKNILLEMIAKRDALAKLLGFASYSHLDLDDEMAKNPETVTKFLQSLYEKSKNKAAQEFDLLRANLPESVKLAHDNKINAWDLRYIKNCYKKKYLKLDEQEIAQYFPTDKTIKELLDIYEQFFSLKFKVSDAKNLWHPDVKLIEIYESTGQNTPEDQKNIGYLLIDLHPRENKFSHACQTTIIPAIKDGSPSLCIVIANFPKETKTKPALMQRDDVETFFHELGHALHSILGRTKIASFSGTNVKTDFVEMPSQMLEEWLNDKEILQKISSHYQTGEPLPDQLIEKIIQIKNFETGDFLQRQCLLATISLEYFANNNTHSKDPKELFDATTSKMRKNIQYGSQDNMYASFGHLTDYGAKYYSYMWSKVFAIDMFCKIKKQGLLNPIAGLEYKEKILAPGGSIDPNILLRDFLGREPSQDAFFDNMGI